MARSLSIAALALIAAAVTAPTARSDGLPMPGVVDTGATGLVSTSGKWRYLALRSGRGTLVVQARLRDATARRTIHLPGDFTTPTVALDGSGDGLSRNDRTLALIRQRRTFPQRTTTLALVDARRMRLRRTVMLRGDFSFDAISPDGGTLYLIQYVSRRDFTRYRVRAFDVARERLLREPVVDPREPGQAMGGMPISRAYSPGRRWAYTLYDGTAGHPFIHALDTERLEARCIDLHDLAELPVEERYGLRLEAGAGAVGVLRAGRLLAGVDSRTHEPVDLTRWSQLPDVRAVLLERDAHHVGPAGGALL